MDKPLINKVAQKAIMTINAEDFIPLNVKGFDLKDFLFQGLLLREKEFRAALKAFDFSSYADAHVYIHCSTDAIIPMWAYMLVSSYLNDFVTSHVFATTKEIAIELFILEKIKQLDYKIYEDQRVIVKGCGKHEVSANVYITLMQNLQGIAKAINFGEACSMVPVYKKTN